MSGRRHEWLSLTPLHVAVSLEGIIPMAARVCHVRHNMDNNRIEFLVSSDSYTELMDGCHPPVKQVDEPEPVHVQIEEPTTQIESEK